jgi:hypothetical protein
MNWTNSARRCLTGEQHRGVWVCVLGGALGVPRSALLALNSGIPPPLLRGCCVEVLGGLKEPSPMSPRLQIIQGRWFEVLQSSPPLALASAKLLSCRMCTPVLAIFFSSSRYMAPPTRTPRLQWQSVRRKESTTGLLWQAQPVSALL